jgi:hypothetical protein
MAATAMDQARLKKQAGVKNTGRKSDDAVLHMTLSWHPDDAKGLSREEMMRAALGALRALRADDRQVLFVSHNDEPQPHVHLLINRVSPEDGRMLSSSKEKLALSRWAEAYERDRGQIRCEERVVNNAARQRGEFTRGAKDRPRHIQELEAAARHAPGIQTVRGEQRRLDAAMAHQTRESARRYASALRELDLGHRTAVASIKGDAAKELARAVTDVRSAYRPRWTALHQDQGRALVVFNRDEERAFGRLRNAVRSLDWSALVRAEDRRKSLACVFEAFASAGARRQQTLRKLESQRAALKREQRRDERGEAAVILMARDSKLAEARRTYLAGRERLTAERAQEAADQNRAWAERSRQRRAAFGSLREERPISPAEQARAAMEAFKRANRGHRPNDRGHERA